MAWRSLTASFAWCGLRLRVCVSRVLVLRFGLFFLMNLVLATIYNAYRKQLEDNMLLFAHKRRESLKVCHSRERLARAFAFAAHTNGGGAGGVRAAGPVQRRLRGGVRG